MPSSGKRKRRPARRRPDTATRAPLPALAAQELNAPWWELPAKAPELAAAHGLTEASVLDALAHAPAGIWTAAGDLGLVTLADFARDHDLSISQAYAAMQSMHAQGLITWDAEEGAHFLHGPVQLPARD
jgi:hypothetical protein